MRISTEIHWMPLLVCVVLVAGSNSLAQDTLVTVGSPPTTFPQNHQEEPALAVDANHPH
jgi:hypothetical protein